MLHLLTHSCPTRRSSSLYVLAGSDRLFNHFDPMRTQRASLGFEIKPCPCFIGIDDEASSRRSAPDGGDPVHIAIAAELDLEKRVARSRGVAGGGFHDGRVGKGNGIGGEIGSAHV